MEDQLACSCTVDGVQWMMVKAGSIDATIFLKPRNSSHLNEYRNTGRSDSNANARWQDFTMQKSDVSRSHVYDGRVAGLGWNAE